MEALIQAGRISASICEDGEADYCAWVAEADWLFVTTFKRPETGGEMFLHFLGLDTECDVWLNGEKIAHHRSLYLPLRLSVSEHLRAENQLAVYFYSPTSACRRYEREMPPEWQDRAARGHAAQATLRPVPQLSGRNPQFFSCRLFRRCGAGVCRDP